MRVAVIFNHPYEGSFCNAILESVSTGLKKGNHELDLFHLDRDRFDPVMTVEDLKAFVDRRPLDPMVIEYTERLKKADHLVFIFPIWWELMPALTKGFIDRVIFPGVAYDHAVTGRGMVPKLTNLKGVTMITTMNTPAVLYRLVFGNAVRKALLVGTFWKLGYKNLKWINLTMVKSTTPARRQRWLLNLENRFTGMGR